ncbi:MAG: hypothetical protein JST78_10535 [Bacteroidetes bacterium]|nr:hypothetical protein [Bacteroidota bacterium]
MNKWEDLKETSKTFLLKSQEAHDDYFIGYSYRWLGVYYENKSMNDSAFYYYLKAEKIFIKLDDKEMLTKLNLDKSNAQIKVFDINGAEKSAIKSLKYAYLINDKLSQYDAFINLGIASTQCEDYDKAIYFVKKALDIAYSNSEFNNLFISEIALNNLGYYYAFMNKHVEASRIYRIALSNKNLQKEKPRIYSTIVGNLAYSDFKTNPNNSTSFLFFTKAIKIADSLGRKSKVAFFKNHLSEYYLYRKDSTRSLKLAREAIEISRKTKSYDDLLMSLKQMAQVDFKNQSFYLKEYINLVDSLYKKERKAKNKFETIAYQTEEITQQKNIALKNYRRVWIVATVIIGLLVLLLIIRAQAAKKRELELKQIQQKANEEISNLMLDQQNKIDTGRALEKKRIAQDLHDGIMNMLASTRINLHLLVQKAPEETRKNFNRFVDGIQDIEKEIRNIAHDLNHGALANKGSFVGIAEALIQEQRNISICRYHLEIDWQIDWEKMAGYKKIHLYRILQEALQNILKHAQAKNVEVSMRKTGDCVLMEIFDDGVGFSFKNKKKGLGLQNIIARAKASDAKAVIKTKINEGTTIEITIPIS